MTASFSNTLFTGKFFHILNETVSTNMYASLLLQQGNVTEGTIVTAKHQTRGRGYAGTNWESESGKNLLFSIIYKPHFIKAKNQFYLNQAISLGVYDAISLFSKRDLKIKWPNDLLLKGKKICGILIENVVSGEWLQSSVIGIGMNVNQTKFGEGVKGGVSLKSVEKKDFDISKVLEKICEHVEARYLQLRRNELSTLQKDYMKTLFQLEEEHSYKTAEGKIKAKIVGINPEGKLLLEYKGGWTAYGFKEVEYL
ncbi:MAG TPA: biotin--[acetyl-CoA-carboxylase] ligase [Bacteroidetes bacterium]|nr:biotin--[acetyl-CoA-carboxylase] ligase [Bacteroidota bacterium]